MALAMVASTCTEGSLAARLRGEKTSNAKETVTANVRFLYLMKVSPSTRVLHRSEGFDNVWNGAVWDGNAAHRDIRGGAAASLVRNYGGFLRRSAPAWTSATFVSV